MKTQAEFDEYHFFDVVGRFPTTQEWDRIQQGTFEEVEE